MLINKTMSNESILEILENKEQLKYHNLQDLVEQSGINKLNKCYSIDDDPNEMELEYKIHRERSRNNNLNHLKESNLKYIEQLLYTIENIATKLTKEENTNSKDLGEICLCITNNISKAAINALLDSLSDINISIDQQIQHYLCKLM